MATQGNAHWTVVIVAEERKFNRTYELSQDTTLNEIMNIWTEECGQSGYWVFTSANRQDRYLGFMTLEMVGETIMDSGIVNLRVKELDEPEPRPTFEIFGHVNDECHYIEVEPELRLYEVLRCLPGRPRELEHNGALLNLEETVDEAGLKNNDVVQECRRQISVSVKLSSGETMIFQVAENSFVLHLFEKVKMYETDDFSLIHQGRYLHMQDRVRNLRHVVEVSMAQFVVDIDGRRISWTTRSEPIIYREFISQLSFHGEFGSEELETMEFSCVGCRRCISKSEDIQVLPIQCCRERSLTLVTTLHSQQSHTNIVESNQVILTAIQTLMEKIHSRTETKCHSESLRSLCKCVYETLEESGLIYNANIELVEKIQKNISKLDATINEITKENESLKANITTFEKESKTLRAKNVASETEIMNLEIENTDLKTNATAFQGVLRCIRQNTGVKLFILYDPSEFLPIVSRPEFEMQGAYPGTDLHIKCVIPELQPGWTTFEVVRDILQPLFSDNVIRVIIQRRGSVKGKTVARVTSRDDDELPKFMKQVDFCDENIRQVTWEEAGKPNESVYIQDGGKVFICGGQRRTVLAIELF